jgi:hypothetical protein
MKTLCEAKTLRQAKRYGRLVDEFVRIYMEECRASATQVVRKRIEELKNHASS